MVVNEQCYHNLHAHETRRSAQDMDAAIEQKAGVRKEKSRARESLKDPRN